jgi:hypothetical protein
VAWRRVDEKVKMVMRIEDKYRVAGRVESLSRFELGNVSYPQRLSLVNSLATRKAYE